MTNETIEFHNLTSIGSNFTNTNATYNARADFYGLDIGLTIRNINITTDLFTSVSGSQNYNATFSSGQILRINNFQNVTATDQSQICHNFFLGMGGLASMSSPTFVMIMIAFIILILVGILVMAIRAISSATESRSTLGKSKTSQKSLSPQKIIVIFLGVVLIAFVVVIMSIFIGHFCTI